MNDSNINVPVRNGNIIHNLTQSLQGVIGNMKVIPPLIERVIDEEMFTIYKEKCTGAEITHSSFRCFLEAPLLKGAGVSLEQLRVVRDAIDEMIRLAIAQVETSA